MRFSRTVRAIIRHADRPIICLIIVVTLYTDPVLTEHEPNKSYCYTFTLSKVTLTKLREGLRSCMTSLRRLASLVSVLSARFSASVACCWY